MSSSVAEHQPNASAINLWSEGTRIAADLFLPEPENAFSTGRSLLRVWQQEGRPPSFLLSTDPLLSPVGGGLFSTAVVAVATCRRRFGCKFTALHM